MNLVFAIDFSHVLLTLLSETVHSVEIHTTKLTGLGITDSAMRAILGILDAADRNPVLHDFDHAFRYHEGRHNVSHLINKFRIEFKPLFFSPLLRSHEKWKLVALELNHVSRPRKSYAPRLEY